MLYWLGRTTGKVALGDEQEQETLLFEVPGANDLWCERAYDALVEAKHVTNEHEQFGFGPSVVSISQSGIELIEAQLNAPDSDIANINESCVVRQEIVTREIRNLRGEVRDQTALKLVLSPRTAEKPESGGSHIPAADRIVGIDHNQPSVEQALKDLDQLIEDVRSTNDFSGVPEDKERAVAELSAVRSLLKATKVRIAAVLAVAAPVLAWVTTNILNETTKELAKRFGAWLSKGLSG